MLRMTIAFASLIFSTCASQSDLTPDQRAKIDPVLQVLLEREDVSPSQYDISIRPDGTREYGIIVYGSAADTLRALGIPLQSVLGEMMTARVSVAQLRLLAAQPTVRAIQNSSRNVPH